MGMEENPQKPASAVPEWLRLTLSLLGFGLVGLMLSFTGNEKHVLWLSIMMLIAAAESAVCHWKYA